MQATGTAADESKPNLARQLERMIQLTGFSDPIYAEAYMDVSEMVFESGLLVCLLSLCSLHWAGIL